MVAAAGENVDIVDISCLSLRDKESIVFGEIDLLHRKISSLDSRLWYKIYQDNYITEGNTPIIGVQMNPTSTRLQPLSDKRKEMSLHFAFGNYQGRPRECWKKSKNPKSRIGSVDISYNPILGDLSYFYKLDGYHNHKTNFPISKGDRELSDNDYVELRWFIQRSMEQIDRYIEEKVNG